jgi:hypothetical protein
MRAQPLPLHHLAPVVGQAFCLALSKGAIWEHHAVSIILVPTTVCVISLHTVLKAFTILAHSWHGCPLTVLFAVCLRMCGCGNHGGGGGGGGGGCTLAAFAAKLTAVDKLIVAKYVTMHSTARLGSNICIVALAAAVRPTNHAAKLCIALQDEDECDTVEVSGVHPIMNGESVRLGVSSGKCAGE